MRINELVKPKSPEQLKLDHPTSFRQAIQGRTYVFLPVRKAYLANELSTVLPLHSPEAKAK